MLDLILEVVKAAVFAVVGVAVPILLPKALNLIAANVHQKDMALIASGAARAAGRISLSIADQATMPGANIKTVIASTLADEVATLKAQLPATIAKGGASDGTLAAMIEGEVGKIVGTALPEVPKA